MQTTNHKQPDRSEYISLTSLQPEEFMCLLCEFGPLCQQYFRHHDLEGNPRRIPKFEEDARCSLAGSFNKLLFLLTFLKENPRQHYHGKLWGMKQPRVSKWVKLLLPLLEQALARLRVLPRRFGCQLYAFLLSFTRFVLLMDAAERRIPRSVDYGRQKHEYSGKKKAHTVKNNLIADQRGSILFLSSTYPGSVHDKEMADQAGHRFPNHTVLVEDLGYLGYGPENISVLVPNKKPRNGELSKQQKLGNRHIRQLRVPVEHVMSGVKRLNIAKEKIRIRVQNARDKIMMAACALHNLRTEYRSNNKKSE